MLLLAVSLHWGKDREQGLAQARGSVARRLVGVWVQSPLFLVAHLLILALCRDLGRTSEGQRGA